MSDTQDERDAAISAPSMGDEWFKTDLAGGGKWEKHTGTIWKHAGSNSALRPERCA